MGDIVELQVLTIRLRLKDKHSAMLTRQARAVSNVWNYCNEMQQKAAHAQRPWLASAELQRLTAGSSKLLGVPAQTICRVCIQYTLSRRQHKRAWLRFRGRRSLGWIPVHEESLKITGRHIRFCGRRIEAMHWRELPPDAVIRNSTFASDTRGRWYLNLAIETRSPSAATAGTAPVGIDLGLKELAALSTGEAIAVPRHYRRLQDSLGRAQRASKKRLTRSIAAKIGNCRKDYLHKASARIALAHDLIVVGNVSSEKLVRTRMAKSVLDAGWSTFRHMLSYKAIRHGGRYVEVNEHMTSRTCSDCGAVGGPQGIAGLGIREWACVACGCHHDRDVNAARNILARGLASLTEGAPQ